MLRTKWRLCDFLVALLVLDTCVCRNSIWSDVGCSLLAEFRSLIMMGTRGFQTLPGLSIGSEKKSKQVIFRWIFWQKYMDRFDNINNRYFDRTEIAHISQNKNSGMSTFNQIHLVKWTLTVFTGVHRWPGARVFWTKQTALLWAIKASPTLVSSPSLFGSEHRSFLHKGLVSVLSSTGSCFQKQFPENPLALLP